MPGAPPQAVTVEPLGARQLLVTWRPPDREMWNGELLGFTIGFQKIDLATERLGGGGGGPALATAAAATVGPAPPPRYEFNYTRVGLAGGSGSDGLADFRLVGLAKYTAYAVTVQAFNAKGDGPPSDAVVAHTLEDVPSAPPQQIACVALTAQNVQVSWQQPPRERLHGVVQGYKLLYEPASLEVEWAGRETKITTALSTVLHGLQPYTNYSVQVREQSLWGGILEVWRDGDGSE